MRAAWAEAHPAELRRVHDRSCGLWGARIAGRPVRSTAFRRLEDRVNAGLQTAYSLSTPITDSP